MTSYGFRYKKKHHFRGARCYDTFVGAYRGCGILPGEESERKTVDNYFSRSDVPRCEQNEVGLPCEVMRHKSGRGKFAISATSVIRGNFIPSDNVCSRAYGSTNDRKKEPVREFAPSDKLPTGKDGAMFRTQS